MPRREHTSRRAFAAWIVAAALGVAGCGKPSEEARQTRRLIDGLLTAVTIKNTKELEKCKGLLDKRHAEGRLPKADLDRIESAVALARAGKWAEAEDALYKYRESRPFPE